MKKLIVAAITLIAAFASPSFACEGLIKSEKLSYPVDMSGKQVNISGQWDAIYTLNEKGGEYYPRIALNIKLNNVRGNIDSLASQLVPGSGCDVWRYNNDASISNQGDTVVAGASATYEDRSCWEYPCMDGWKITKCKGWSKNYTHVHHANFYLTPINRYKDNVITVGVKPELKIEWKSKKSFGERIKTIDLKKVLGKRGEIILDYFEYDKNYRIRTDGSNLLGSATISAKRPMKKSLACLAKKELQNAIK